MAIDRLLGNTVAGGQEDDPADARAKGSSAATSDQASAGAPSGIAASAEATVEDDPAFAKAHPLPQTALLPDAAQRNAPPAPSKPSSNDAGHSGGGGGGGGAVMAMTDQAPENRLGQLSRLRLLPAGGFADRMGSAYPR